MLRAVMTAVILVAALVSLAAGAVWFQRSAPMPAALRVLPAALLLLTVPAGSSAYWIIRQFREIGIQGHSGAEMVARLMTSVSESMLFASLALIITMIVVSMFRSGIDASTDSATLQLSSAVAVEEPQQTTVTPTVRTGGVPKLFALATPLAIVPAVVVAWTLADVISMVLRAVVGLTGPNPVAEIAGMQLGEISQWISIRLVVIVAAGIAGSIALAFLALLNALPMKQTVDRRIVIYGRVAAGVTAIAGAMLAFRFAVLLRTIG
jgi:hypothetical protein